VKGGARPRSGPIGKGLEQHLTEGTFRPARHGKLLAAAQAFTVPDEPGWQPTAQDLEPLGARGRRFLDEMQGEYQLNFVDGQRALQAARVMDRIGELEAMDRTALTAGESTSLGRLELSWRTLLARLLSELAVRE
jgi:hypothetical protein